jgi:hypothetical protein
VELAFVGKVLGGGQCEARCDDPFDGRVVGEVEKKRRVLYVCVIEEEDGRMEDGGGWDGKTLHVSSAERLRWSVNSEF